MDITAGKLSNEHKEQFRSASESADPLTVSALQISPKSPRSPKSPKSPKSPRSPRSPGDRHSKHGSDRGSPLKHKKNSHSPRDGRPKKGGCGGKGTWGGLMDTDDVHAIDPNDPNYTSSEEVTDLKGRNSLLQKCRDTERTSMKDMVAAFEEYKKKAIILVEEYFQNDDITSTANELRELGMSCYDFYFIKKLVSMAMDRHDKEKEMAAVLLSALYAEVIKPQQVYKGFSKLLESADDFIVDIPDAVDILALFIARAVVDDILPPAFLAKANSTLPKDSKGIEVIKRAEKSYLSAPLHAEIIERRWGGSKNKTVEDVKDKINNLIIEYVVSGEKNEACRCINDLNMRFFHHEIVKRAIIMAMEKQQAESRLLDLLKKTTEEGLINSSQLSKGFNRIIDNIDDLSLDIPNARMIFQSIISKGASEGWLCISSLKSFSTQLEKQEIDEKLVKEFKLKAQSMIQEYFLSGDIEEVSRILESENSSCLAELNAIFVKKLITLAMDRKNREKEMASVLLSSVCFPADDVVNGFVMLIEAADDTALDIPIVVEDLAMFLARAEVDEVLTPQHMEEIGSQFFEPNSIGNKVVLMAKSLLKGRLSGERILRCWGGGGSSTNGWAIEDVKDKIRKLLEEFESGGDAKEAYRCIKELGMPFFHHEVVKKSLVIIIEKKSERLWGFLKECFSMGLITMYQMTKGFARVAESLDDLALDVPDAEKQFKVYVERAEAEGWLDSTFSFNRLGHNSMENGFC